MKLFKQEQGLLLATAIMIGATLTIIALAVVQFSLQHYTTARRGVAQLSALSLAEAGGDNAVFSVNQNNTYTGTDNGVCTAGNETALFNNNTQGKGTYETCVVAGSIANEKVITSIGRVYLPASASKPFMTRKIKVIIEGSTPTPYAVETGPGGLLLNNNVIIGNGQVYVNGFIKMNNNSQIGTPATPATVWAAHYDCPAGPNPGATYPAACTTGGTNSPISFGGNTVIYGTVNANYQQNSTHMKSPGLQQTSGVTPAALPDLDRPGTKTSTTVTWDSDKQSQVNSCQNGYTTWTNVHITFDVNLPNNCTVTISGNVWISGNFSTMNDVNLVVPNGLTTQPIVMIDGSNGFAPGNNLTIAANPLGVGLKIVTFWNSTGNPDSVPTGNDLYSSWCSSGNCGLPNGLGTPKITINLGNNLSAAAGTMFYARWSTVQLGNNATIGQILGQYVILNNNGTVSFTGSTGNGNQTWDVRYYEQQ